MTEPVFEQKPKNGDIIEMTLNLNECLLRYKLNGKIIVEFITFSASTFTIFFFEYIPRTKKPHYKPLAYMKFF